MTRIYRGADNTGVLWQEFLIAMRYGKPVEIDGEMWFYWLEVLPPARGPYEATLPTGQVVRALFGFAEGEECIVAFWRDGQRRFCCRTNELNRMLPDESDD